MKKYIFLTLSYVIFISVVFAQQWTVRYNGTGNGMDEIKAMVVDNSGNVYITGYSFSGANGNDYITIKYNTNGVQQWLAQYNGTGNGSDIPNSIFIDNEGNVYVTGASNRVSGAIFDTDATTVKYNSQGVQLWVGRYDGVNHKADGGNAIKVDPSGNVFVTGYTTISHGSSYARKDYLTIKYSASGEQIWVVTYNGPANNQDDEAIGIGLDLSGNVYVGGTSFAGNDPLGEQDYLTIKYSPLGIEQWTARYNGPISEADYATAFTVDNAGNSYITGTSRNGGIDNDYATIKYNTSGVQQWIARYGGAAGNGDTPDAIALDNSGNVYVTGSDQQIAYNYDYRTIKYNSSGSLQWTARYNGPVNGNDGANAIAVDRNGNVFVTGFSNGLNFNLDIATVKYSSTGVQQWVMRYDGPRDSADVGNTIGLDSIGNVYVAGASTGQNTAWDFTTLKYSSELTGTQTLHENQPSSFALFQNYPNPFNPVTTINFTLPEENHVSLRVYDELGKEISVLVNENKAPGYYSIILDATDLSSGIYFYKLSAGNFLSTKRMILIK